MRFLVCYSAHVCTQCRVAQGIAVPMNIQAKARSAAGFTSRLACWTALNLELTEQLYCVSYVAAFQAISRPAFCVHFFIFSSQVPLCCYDNAQNSTTVFHLELYIGYVYWWCVDGGKRERGTDTHTYFHVISDRCNYSRFAMIALRELALQGVAQSPTIMLTHCSVCDAHKLWLCLGRFNHSVFGNYWPPLFCVTSDSLLKYSSVIIVLLKCFHTWRQR